MPRGGKRPNQTGRPPLPEEEKMVARLIDLPPAMWDELEQLASKHQQKRNAYIRNILQGAIDADRS